MTPTQPRDPHAVAADPSQPEPPDPERWLIEAFQAPEGVWNSAADRIRLDVFGLGALAFYLLTGQPPAPSANALKTRLQSQHGLDVAIELPQVSTALRSLVFKATQPSPTQRTPDVSTVLAQWCPDGVIRLRRLRRTLAWFIYRKPSGRGGSGYPERPPARRDHGPVRRPRLDRAA